MKELQEIKQKLHLMAGDDFKDWYDKYRLQVRKNAEQGIGWQIEEMNLFHEISRLHLICKAIRHAIVNSADGDYSVTFFEFFGDVRLAEMCNKKIEVTTFNLH